MPIVGGALLPNAHLLLPGLAPQLRKTVTKTMAAASLLAHELYARQPDVLVLVAVDQATSAIRARFGLLQSPTLPYSFEDLGDLTTSGTARLSIGLVHHLKELCETAFPLPLITPSSLSPAFAIPLVLLGKPLNALPVIPLRLPSDATHEELYRVSQLLGNELGQRAERTLVIGAGILAHGQPGARSGSRMYDQQFLSALQADTPERLINLDSHLRRKAGDTLWPAAVAAWQMYGERRVRVERSSYEAPAGTGYLVGRFADV